MKAWPFGKFTKNQSNQSKKEHKSDQNQKFDIMQLRVSPSINLCLNCQSEANIRVLTENSQLLIVVPNVYSQNHISANFSKLWVI